MLFFALRELRQTDLTESNGWSHRRHTVLAKWQLGSDFLIAVAYFSIPLELVYFLIKSQVLPFRWVIALFGLFIVLCGITHLLTLWNFYVNSEAAHIGMTIAKVVTATVSCLTAVLLIWVIPELLDVKKREEFYTQKTAELDVEVGNIKKDQQVLKHVRMLTDEIRSSLDRHKILSTTMIELSHTLELESCNIWMPRASANVLELAHKLGAQDAFAPPEIPLSTSLVDLVFSNNGAVVVPSKALGPLAGAGQTSLNHGSVVAIRIPLLASSGCVSHPDKECYALMVLSFPKNLQKAWGDHELELVEAVADQVAVALSHAAVVEETLKVQDQLIEQNLALQKAKKEAESAVVARNEFLVVMNHEMRTPMHAIIALSSLLLDSGLTPDQQSMVETISKSGSLLSTLINDVLDFSRLEAGSLTLDIQPFKVAKLLDDAERLVSPLAVAKHLPFALKRMGFLPDTVMGDSTRILQVLLNVVGNAIKFTAQGHVHLTVFASKAPDAQVSHEPASPGRSMTQRYIHFEVEDTGIGIRATDLPRLFNKFVQADSSTSRKYGGSGLGLAISKKFVEVCVSASFCSQSG
ncbi:ethylene receptor 2-like [Selaginella moellendorffii]|uniref:ethylene receptor 2-like n=1 Tax=Selaginella moellendorffii TaxID=88036 RepID=UPI000D1C5CE3|nr:ethylene receptor 2-like [Selaginella moellendorffii]|eukprot:XP_024532406.1 ethylene receptor 2-like [Selaginella moellendorffii]